MQQKRLRGRPRSAFTEQGAGTLQSLDRALGVLMEVARVGRMTLSDLSHALDVPTATTHRILNTLQKRDFVIFDKERQDWAIGIEAFRTGASFLSRTSLSEIGRPVMRALMEQTGETANMAVPHDRDVVFVEQIETLNPVRACFNNGTRSAMHSSGIGKAILAARPRAEVEQLFQNIEFQAFTDKTLISSATLLADLDATRKRGWSHDNEERYSGMSCVAAAIFDEKALPCAGVSVSGPTSRLSATHLPAVAEAVCRAATEITERSGGRLPTDAP